MRIKICGLTSYADAAAALDAGADALGFVLAGSPRRMTPEQILEIRRRLPFILSVGVLVDADPGFAARLLAEGVVDRLQLHGKALPLPGAYPSVSSAPPDPLPSLLHVDASRGQGRLGDWELAKRLALRTRVILAGGLTPANVAEAVAGVRPFGVDVSSGVEATPGKKDPRKVREFCDAARR